jgi:hypothetical protein
LCGPLDGFLLLMCCTESANTLFCCSLHLCSGCRPQGPLVRIRTDSVQAQLELPAQLLQQQAAYCTVLGLRCRVLARPKPARCAPCVGLGCASRHVPLLLLLGLVQLTNLSGILLWPAIMAAMAAGNTDTVITCSSCLSLLSGVQMLGVGAHCVDSLRSKAGSLIRQHACVCMRKQAYAPCCPAPAVCTYVPVPFPVVRLCRWAYMRSSRRGSH